ncbi:MAG: radical SAM protein [bacterium]|nr:radical SAM protein [bacterium]
MTKTRFPQKYLSAFESSRRKLQPIKDKILHRRILNNKNISIPKTLIFELTTKCNLNCKMCYYPKTKEGKELSLDSIYLIFKKLAPFHFKNCYITGAEPFTRTNLTEVCKIIADRNIKISIQTNGTLFTEQRLRELQPFISHIGISIDGLEPTHDTIRNMKGTFSKAIEGIKLCRKIGIPVKIDTIILDENLEELEELIFLLTKLRVKDINLSLLINQNTTTDYKTPVIKIRKVIMEILKKNKNVNLSPSLLTSDFKAVYDGTIMEHMKLSCWALWNVRIDPNGSIIHCPLMRKKFGNLLVSSDTSEQATTFSEIWNCMEFKNFRKTLLENNLFSICKRCCRIKSRF